MRKSVSSRCAILSVVALLISSGPLLLLSGFSVRDRVGLLADDNPVPPYRWSISRGATADEVIITAFQGHSFDLLRFDLKSGQLCGVTHTDGFDEINPEWQAPLRQLTAIREDRKSGEQVLVIFDRKGEGQDRTISLGNRECGSPVFLTKDQFVVPARRRRGLAAETELYLCGIEGDQFSWKAVTENSEIEGPVFFSPSLRAVFWNGNSPDSDEPAIIQADLEFQNRTVKGNGSIYDYCEEKDQFLTVTGIGRFSVLNLRERESGRTEQIFADRNLYTISARFLDKGQTIAVFSNDGGYSVMLHLLTEQDGEWKAREVLRLDMVGERWVRKIEARVIPLEKCR